MAFELVSQTINAFIERRYVTDVVIDRHLYGHCTARIVLDCDEEDRERDKETSGAPPTGRLGANLLDADVTLHWRGRDLEANTNCFHGYVTGISARREATRSYLVLDCISYSKRTDLLPRFRVWQSCTLLDVCQHIVSKESLFEICSNAKGVLGGITLDLSVQGGETDFEYLSRMLHAWGIPLGTDDRKGKVFIGAPDIESSGGFPDENWHWSAIDLQADLLALGPKPGNAGGGATGRAKQYVKNFNLGLKRTANEYAPRLDDPHQEEREWTGDRADEVAFQSDPVTYRLQWEGSVFDFSPGTAVKLFDEPYLVRSVRIEGDPNEDKVSQEFVLQCYLAPSQPGPKELNWPSRIMWAKVTKNNHEDPQQRGRLQVEFDVEELDDTGNDGRRCWLPTVTPYGGLKGKSGTSGFLSVPEVGERVLVQFLNDWDSDAVILGSVRDLARDGFVYDPHETKRWQTPSGNQVTLTTRDNGKTDLVRLKCQDKLIFEGKVTPSKQTVIMDLADSTGDRIQFEGGAGPPRLDIFCGGEIYIHAGMKLLLEGGQVQIKSTMGNVNINGAPMVMINCSPWGLQPLQMPQDNPKEGPKSEKRKRTKPPVWAAAVAPTLVSEQPETTPKEKTWIEIELLDDAGNPVPHERFWLRLTDGTIIEGRLDANARARVEALDPGQCLVRFPDYEGSEWHPPGVPATVPPASAPSRRQPEQDWIEIELVDENGDPSPNERYELRLPDGTVRTGTLDANGRAREDGVDPGECEVRFPNVEDSEWRPVGPPPGGSQPE